MDALTAIGFMKEKSAALAMIKLAKSPDKTISEMASYWLSFRQGNEWYCLAGLEKLRCQYRV